MKNSAGKKNCRRFYGHGIPGVKLEELAGKLIVVEGADGSGRSTQIARLVEWLETCGHATVQVGLKRSTLVSEELDKAQARKHFEPHDVESVLRDGFCRPIGKHHPARAPGRIHRAGRPLYLHADGARHGARHERRVAEKSLRHRARYPTRFFISPSSRGTGPAQPRQKRGARLLGKRHGSGPVARYVRQLSEIPDRDADGVPATAEDPTASRSWTATAPWIP